jgi:diaminopimelate epimerase
MQFTKAHGAGNDFVIVDDRRETGRDWANLAAEICDRHFGVGADGLILVQEAESGGYQMVMYNPDGSRAEMCGNGIRCLGQFLYREGVIQTAKVPVLTDAGERWVQVIDSSPDRFYLAAGMGTPEFDPKQIPIDLPGAKVIDYPLDVGNQQVSITAVSMGNPHAVCFVDSMQAVDLATVGPIVENHPIFPEGTNFEICRVVTKSRLQMRVWERGAGITLACGSGAAATAAAAIISGRIPPGEVSILVDGGELGFHWGGDSGELVMTGPAETVYDGQWQK